MHGFLRATVKTLFLFSSLLLAVFSLMMGGVFSPNVSAKATTPQQATVYNNFTKGAISPVAIANLQSPAAAAAPTLKNAAAQGQDPDVLGQLPIPRGVHQASVRAPANASIKSTALAAPGQLLQNFDGTSSRDSQLTNAGRRFEPPDQGLCVGAGFVMEPINDAVNIYRTNGQRVLGPFNVDTLFAEPFFTFVSDPRCYYDRLHQTWFATAVELSTNAQGQFTGESRTDIAVNRSNDPTTPWTVYHLEGTDDGSAGTPSHPGCPCLGDQPLFGIDQANIYISTNEFAIPPAPGFNGAQIYEIPILPLLTSSSNVPFTHFEQLSIGGSIATSVQPATEIGANDTEYFLSSLDPNGTSDNRIGVWAMSDLLNVGPTGAPTLSSLVLTSQTYSSEPAFDVIQKGSPLLLTAGDDRMQATQFINNSIWGALGTAVTIPGDPTPRDGLAWFQVNPSMLGFTLGSATIVNQGTVASAGNYLFVPAIAAAANGTVAMTFTFSGPNNFPSAAYAIMASGQTSFGDVHIAADGTGPYADRNANTRWGDYSYATVDPDTLGNIWLATEYVPPAASQAVGGIRNWGTRVFEVSASS